MKEDLKNKKKTELVDIARRENIKGYSNKNKSELIDLIISHRSKNNIISFQEIVIKLDKLWKSIVDAYIRVILIIVAASITIFSFFYPTNNSDKTKIIKQKNYVGSSKFDILLLPFYPSKNCIVENTDYEMQVLERLKELKKEGNLNVNAQLSREYDCTTDIHEIQKIAKKERVELIIWGEIVEDCTEETEIRLRYYYSGNNQLQLNKFGDTDYQPLADFRQLRTGYLQNDIEYIIKVSLGLSAYNIANYDIGINILESIQISECDSTILQGLAIGYFAINAIQKADSLVYLILNCDKNNFSGNKLKTEILAFKKGHNELIEFANKVIDKDSLDFGTRLQRAISYIEIGDYDNAKKDIKFIERKDKREGKSYDILRFKNLLNTRQRNYKEAIEGLNKSLEASSGWSTDLFSVLDLSRVYFMNGDTTKAFALNDTLIKYHKHNPVSYIKKVGEYFIKHEPDSAHYFLKEGLRIFPEDEFLKQMKVIYDYENNIE